MAHQRQYAHKLGAALRFRHVFESLKQLGIVCRIALPLSVTRGVNTWRATEKVHRQPGVVGQRWQARNTRRVTGHPYGGDLVFTAFSGSHQDAIKKGFDDMERQSRESGKAIDELVWGVPYLPVDPHDLGRSYEAVVRVNSQSGKGGVAYLMRTEHQLDLPRRMQIELSGVVQKRTDAEGGEMSAAALWELFSDEYLPGANDGESAWGRFAPVSVRSESDGDGKDHIWATITDQTHGGREITIDGRGNGPIDAFVNALSTIGVDVRVLDYAEHALSSGETARAAAYVECAVGERVLWGVGVHSSIVRASLSAILSAVNRAERDRAASPTSADAPISRPGGGP